MDGMDGGTREKLLSKLMDFLAMLPDEEKAALDGGSEQSQESEPKLEIDAKPEASENPLDKLKGL